MMIQLTSDVLRCLEGKTLSTAESCTGGGIGAELTAIPGSSKVYKGGIISYTDWVKEHILGVDKTILAQFGAVSEPVAKAMAEGVRQRLKTDIAVSITGLAGPGGDDWNNLVGTVFIGYCDENVSFVKKFCFSGDREMVRNEGIRSALQIILEENQY